MTVEPGAVEGKARASSDELKYLKFPSSRANMNIHTFFSSIHILNKPCGFIFEHESLNFQTSFEKESSQLNTSENAALKRRLAIFYSPRQHSLAHYCCKRSR